MTFKEWWKIYSLENYGKECCIRNMVDEEIWNRSRLETMIEVRDWLASKKKWLETMNGTEGAKVIVDELWVAMACNVERGGEWSSSVLMNND